MSDPTPIDPIDPPHYHRTALEPRDVTASWFGMAGVLAHVIKYLYRAGVGHKRGCSVLEDLQKAEAWLKFAIEVAGREGEDGP